MKIDELRIVLALEPSWTISINGREFLHVRSSDITLEGSSLRFDRFARMVVEVESIRPAMMRIHCRTRFRSQTDVLLFYAGERLPSAAELRRRRTAFLRQLVPEAAKHFGARVIRQTLHTDKQHGVSGSYPRLLAGSSHAMIAVDPDESSPVVNGILRAAIHWARIVRRRITVVVPSHRGQTIVTRLASLPRLRESMNWLAWDGAELKPLDLDQREVQTQVLPYKPPDVEPELTRILSLAPPNVLQAVPQIAGNAVSVRFRGLEIARLSERGTSYPLGEPLQPLIDQLLRERRSGSRHPLARAHEEAWLESNLIAQIRDLLPVRVDTIYPQVPSFSGSGAQERKIIDLLTVTDHGRLVVMEIKVSADPDLAFQALDYWLAVERHRKAGDFKANGYFAGVPIRDEAALLVMVAPLLAFHRSLDRQLSLLPSTVPLLQIGLNQTWKKEIKVLRRKGALG